MPRNNENTQQVRVNSIVEGTRIQGELNSPGNFRIDGTVEGTLRIEGRLIIGAKGKVIGEVVCKDADVEGMFQGKIEVNGMLSLKSRSAIEGEATFQRLTVEEGAKLKCTCNLSESSTDSKGTQMEAPARDSSPSLSAIG